MGEVVHLKDVICLIHKRNQTKASFYAMNVECSCSVFMKIKGCVSENKPAEPVPSGVHRPAPELLIRLAVNAQIARHSFSAGDQKAQRGALRNSVTTFRAAISFDIITTFITSLKGQREADESERRTKRNRRRKVRRPSRKRWKWQTCSCAGLSSSFIPHACLVLKLATLMLDFEQLQVYSTGPVWCRHI